MAKLDMETYEGVQKYFNDCKDYWIRHGEREGVATSKAFWFDCVEIFNALQSWNDAKRKFAKDFRGYEPGDPVPDAKKVEEGGV